MLEINCFLHEEFTSNTYLVTHKNAVQDVYLIDIGNSHSVLNALQPYQKVKGIFITHAHYDHIYGINDIMKKFPDCTVYCSQYAHDGLLSDKLNLSFYHDDPVIFTKKEASIIHDGDQIELYIDTTLKVIETPGHNMGSVSFIIENCIFTGDSLIPGYPVVTKLKSGNKEEAIESIHKIRQVSKPTDILYPGHATACKISEIDWNFYIANDGRN